MSAAERLSFNAAMIQMRSGLDPAANLATMREQLERLHVGSRVNTLSAEDNRAEMARNLTNALQTADNAKANLAAEMAQRDAYVQKWHADINDQLALVTGQLSDATGQLRTAELHQKLVDLRAGQDGTVLTVAQVSLGSVVQSGQPFFTLMPAAAPLEVEGIIATSDGGFARAGDPVTIKIDAFPHRKFKGHVDSIQAGSGTAFTLLPAENATGNYVKIVQRVPVKIVFDEQPNVLLGPGMSVIPTVRVR